MHYCVFLSDELLLTSLSKTQVFTVFSNYLICIDCIIISLLYTDTKKMPLGKLSQSQIAKGFEVIIEQRC